MRQKPTTSQLPAIQRIGIPVGKGPIRTCKRCRLPKLNTLMDEDGKPICGECFAGRNGKALGIE